VLLGHDQPIHRPQLSKRIYTQESSKVALHGAQHHAVIDRACLHRRHVAQMAEVRFGAPKWTEIGWKT
jgi:hypothetical protein